MSPDSSHKLGGRERRNSGGHRGHGGARTGDADAKAEGCQPEGYSQQPLETPANSRQVLGCCRQEPVSKTLVIKVAYWDLAVARNRWPWSRHHAEPESRRSLLSYPSLHSLFLVIPRNTGPWRARMGRLRGMTTEPRHILFARNPPRPISKSSTQVTGCLYCISTSPHPCTTCCGRRDFCTDATS